MIRGPRPHRLQTRTPARAFTLFEALLAAVLIAAVGAIGLLAVSAWAQRVGVGESAAAVRSAIREARAIARETGVAVELRVARTPSGAACIDLAPVAARTDLEPSSFEPAPSRTRTLAEFPPKIRLAATRADAPDVFAVVLPTGDVLAAADLRVESGGRSVTVAIEGGKPASADDTPSQADPDAEDAE